MNAIISLYKKYREIIMYVIFGGLTTAVSFVSHFAVRMIGADFSYLDGGFSLTAINSVMESSVLPAEAATIISWICAVTFAFFTNKAYVFRSETHTFAAFMKQFALFYSARLVSLLLEIAIIFIFVTCLHLNEMGTKLAAQIVILVTNYLFSKLVVFRRKKEEKNGEA